MPDPYSGSGTRFTPSCCESTTTVVAGRSRLTPNRIEVGQLKRTVGIEPTSSDWKAEALPLDDARESRMARRDGTRVPDAPHVFGACPERSREMAHLSLHLKQRVMDLST